MKSFGIPPALPARQTSRDDFLYSCTKSGSVVVYNMAVVRRDLRGKASRGNLFWRHACRGQYGPNKHQTNRRLPMIVLMKFVCCEDGNG